MLPASAASKQSAILDAAEDVFLRNGYVGSSMDEVAASAGVSKQTVYKHFASKEALFHALITAAITTDPAHRVVDLTPELGDGLPNGLRSFARHLLAGVMQPRVLRLRRLVIGEATRFPDLGRAFYEAGPAVMATELARRFEAIAAADDGLLRIDDADSAAQHFIWLVLSIPLNRAMLLGDDHGMTDDDLDRYADLGVDVFLAAYGRARD